MTTGSGLKDTKAISRIAKTAKHVVPRKEPLIGPIQIGKTKPDILTTLRRQPLLRYGIWKELRSERRITVPQRQSAPLGTRRDRPSQKVVNNEDEGRDGVFCELTKKREAT